ncbi:hypothetical protein [Modestobacter sp. Leaf380]|uniref:hypothetical protein n=1 Tax=Modestobacter sp. Leaf380 TaxID=1736356 RepID=UPI0006FD5D1D|nr:hypothetical protein [Modestobacter sp. Leaf380]KQS68795.1 hypothetical protein ASG41_07770 [Modestobacter sp. Leaf380]
MDRPAPARLCSPGLVACLVLGFLGCLLMGAVAADLPGTSIGRWLDPAAPFALPRVYAAALAAAVVVALRAVVDVGRARHWSTAGAATVGVLLAAPTSAVAVTSATVVALVGLVAVLVLVDARADAAGGRPSATRTLTVPAS